MPFYDPHYIDAFENGQKNGLSAYEFADRMAQRADLQKEKIAALAEKTKAENDTNFRMTGTLPGDLQEATDPSKLEARASDIKAFRDSEAGTRAILPQEQRMAGNAEDWALPASKSGKEPATVYAPGAPVKATVAGLSPEDAGISDDASVQAAIDHYNEPIKRINDFQDTLRNTKQSVIDKNEAAAQKAKPDPMAVTRAAMDIIEHRKSPSQIVLYGRSDFRKSVLDKVDELAPNFDFQNAEVEYKRKVGEAATESGAKFMNVVRGSEVALQQIGDLKKASAAFPRTDVQQINKIGIAAAAALGNKSANQLISTRNIVMLEMNNMETNPTDEKMAIIRDLTDPKKNVQQMADSLAIVEKFARSRHNAYSRSGAPPPAGKDASPSPAVGTVRKGYKFKGGDAGQKGNWEKVQP